MNRFRANALWVEHRWHTVGRARNSVAMSDVPDELQMARQRGLSSFIQMNPDVVDQVVNDRSPVPLDSPNALCGRVLVYAPRFAIGWALARLASDWLVDDTECPGWDLWVGWGESEWCGTTHAALLVSWIPAELVPRINAAIEENPDFSLEWADEPGEYLDQDGRDAIRDCFEFCDADNSGGVSHTSGNDSDVAKLLGRLCSSTRRAPRMTAAESDSFKAWVRALAAPGVRGSTNDFVKEHRHLEDHVRATVEWMIARNAAVSPYDSGILFKRLKGLGKAPLSGKHVRTYWDWKM